MIQAALAEAAPVDWFIHRIAASTRYNGSPSDVRRWPIFDVFHAHLVLDAFAAVDGADVKPPKGK